MLWHLTNTGKVAEVCVSEKSTKHLLRKKNNTERSTAKGVNLMPGA